MAGFLNICIRDFRAFAHLKLDEFSQLLANLCLACGPTWAGNWVQVYFLQHIAIKYIAAAAIL
jgi:hypothetical protein